jgi:hypothetical protein
MLLSTTIEIAGGVFVNGTSLYKENVPTFFTLKEFNKRFN